MANYKTVPNQKKVKVKKVGVKGKLFAQIELNALEEAARELKAGAFKLWVYFAKNQDDYEFALSSSDALATFGMKKDQYDSAVKELIEKGYLVLDNGNSYTFNEVVGKNHNERNAVVGKNHNSVVGKNHNQLQEKTTTRCSKNPQEILQDIINSTNNNTAELSTQEEEGTMANPIKVEKAWLRAEYQKKPQNWKSFDAAGVVYHLPTQQFYKGI